MMLLMRFIKCGRSNFQINRFPFIISSHSSSLKKDFKKISPKDENYFQFWEGDAYNKRGLYLNIHNKIYFINPNDGDNSYEIIYKNLKQFKSKQKTILFTSRNWRSMGGMIDLFLNINATMKEFKVKALGFSDVTPFLLSYSMTNKRITDIETIDEDLIVEDNHEIERINLKLSHSSTLPGLHSLDKSWEWIFSPVSPKLFTNQYVSCYIIKMKSTNKSRDRTQIKISKRLSEIYSNVDESDIEDNDIYYLIVDVPNLNYLKIFLNSKLNSEFLNKKVKYIFHYTPEKIIKSSQYQNWMESFNYNTQHISCRQLGISLKKLEFFEKLRLIAPDLFPKLWLLYKNNLPKSSEIKDSPKRLYLDENFYYNKNDEESFDEKLVEENLYNSKVDVKKLLSESHEKMTVDYNVYEYPKVTFLGTGSTVSSLHRNVSGILVEIDKNHFILLDCGKRTINQMILTFGVEKTKEILKNLKLIFISHYHFDHHLGLISLLKRRLSCFTSEMKKPLYLITPRDVAKNIHFYNSKFESIIHQVIYAHGKNFFINEKIPQDLLKYSGLRDLRTIFNFHCFDSYSISLVSRKTNFKIVYSSDLSPNKEFVKFSTHNSLPDLLIHEATLSNIWKKACEIKNHCTFTQAIEQSKATKAKFTIFTHFSQRYGKVFPLDEFKGMKNFGIAFDHMSVNPRNLHHSNAMLPAIDTIFQKEIDIVRKRDKKSYDNYENLIQKGANEELISRGLDPEDRQSKKYGSYMELVQKLNTEKKTQLIEQKLNRKKFK